MVYYSHSETIPDKSKIGTKLLQDHILGVLTKALNSFEISATLHLENDYLKKLISDACQYHDLGKYTNYFQKYLLTNDPVDLYLKQHARFGAYSLFQKYKEKDIVVAVFLYFIIINHHRNLGDIRSTEFSRKIDFNSNKEIFDKQKANILASIKIIKNEFAEDFEPFLNAPDSKLFYQVVKQITYQHPSIQNYFLINYLFSLLIEADKLDASDTLLYPRKSIDTSLVDQYRPLNLPSSKTDKDTGIRGFDQNQVRSYARVKTSGFLERENWAATKLFTLTAPTGIGKTLIALDFALKLKAKIRKIENRDAQIIYALPFINIIEQSYEVYEKVFENQDVNLLAHYQYADALEQIKGGKDIGNPDKETKYNQKVMMLDTWQCDVVITTFVQFLQTLIGNRNKLLKKFNHFAGSVIILDEVQTLRLAYLPLVGAALYYLSKFLNARVVLMTATKPKVFELANQEILGEDDKAAAVELLDDFEEVFQCFQRTAIVPMIDKKIADEKEFLEKYFLEKWDDSKSCIIVCNTVKRSSDLFNLLRDNVDNPIYYLSTNIVPLHRQSIIHAIQNDLKLGLKPVLVSTQCVEAGVDLDFDMGFRDLSPIDSIVQVAGRINRNNNPGKKYSPLYVIDFGDCERIYDKITMQQSQKALKKFAPQINEEQYLEMIGEYFNNISDRSSFAISRDIFNAMKTLKYDSDDPKKDIAVSSFQVISETYPALSIFVELDDASVDIKNLFCKLIHKEITQEEFSNSKKSFHQRIISIPSHLPKADEIKRNEKYLLCEGLYFIPYNELADFYDIITGFNRSKENKEHSMFL
ncbi:MAG TPA: CRISPR-associated helicase Cas3' [Chitinophagaceae bacterium]